MSLPGDTGGSGKTGETGESSQKPASDQAGDIVEEIVRDMMNAEHEDEAKKCDPSDCERKLAEAKSDIKHKEKKIKEVIVL